jgi:hypothetical protein
VLIGCSDFRLKAEATKSNTRRAHDGAQDAGMRATSTEIAA